MKLRVLLFEDQTMLRKAIANALRSESYEVLDFSSPICCSIGGMQKCECPHDHVCADVIISDINMPKMSGLELIRLQSQKGCHAHPQNKIIISGKGTQREEEEILAMGCHFLRKPFQIHDLLALLNECKKNIPSDRKLVPCEELLRVAQN